MHFLPVCPARRQLSATGSINRAYIEGRAILTAAQSRPPPLGRRASEHPNPDAAATHLLLLPLLRRLPPRLPAAPASLLVAAAPAAAPPLRLHPAPPLRLPQSIAHRLPASCSRRSPWQPCAAQLPPRQWRQQRPRSSLLAPCAACSACGGRPRRLGSILSGSACTPARQVAG